MNILVTLDAGYLPQLRVMLCSLLINNPNQHFDIYIAHSSLLSHHFSQLETEMASRISSFHDRCRFLPIQVDSSILNDAPITTRYPQEMYYRIFAAQYLPGHLDQILYLDPDIVIIGSLRELYEKKLGSNLFAAATHVRKNLQKLNQHRLDMLPNAPYINSGVMLMNLKLLRQVQSLQEVMKYIKTHKTSLFLPDQDIISALYGDKIFLLDTVKYNLSERYFNFYRLRPENISKKLTIDWVRKNAVIIHFCGRNKPWKPSYLGSFDQFYHEYANM